MGFFVDSRRARLAEFFGLRGFGLVAFGGVLWGGGAGVIPGGGVQGFVFWDRDACNICMYAPLWKQMLLGARSTPGTPCIEPFEWWLVLEAWRGSGLGLLLIPAAREIAAGVFQGACWKTAVHMVAVARSARFSDMSGCVYSWWSVVKRRHVCHLGSPAQTPSTPSPCLPSPALFVSRTCVARCSQCTYAACRVCVHLDTSPMS